MYFEFEKLDFLRIVAMQTSMIKSISAKTHRTR